MADVPLLKADGGRVKAPPQSSSGCCCCAGDTEDVDFEDIATPSQMVLVRDTRMEFAVPFAKGSPEAETVLGELYRAATGGKDPPAPTGDHWKELGFQGKDPSTDVRGAGLHGLRLLVRLCEELPYFHKSLHLSREEYPFAASSLNVARVLVCHLKLFMAAPSFCPCCGVKILEARGDRKVMLCVLDLIASDDDAMFNIYIATMLLLDSEWRRMRRADSRFTLIRFNEVLLTTRKKILRLLSAHPESSDALLAAACHTARVPVADLNEGRTRPRRRSRRATMLELETEEHK